MSRIELKIEVYPAAILRKRCLPVEEIGENEINLLKNMAETMYRNRGIGLAAPQVGVNKQIIIADIGRGLIELINPQVFSPKGKDKMEEGCLSLPGISVVAKRPKEVIVSGLNRRGKKVEMRLRGLMARVIQHEVDHLRGILIIDYVNFIKRFSLVRRMKRS
ncbi:MAG: peptide deformylase [Candidatus Omnitrophica bacterium 4484_213]|nr:MAG: peptide deformylase [Candidatus Omnitrophica bacterium 4484_213]